jgi:hypothetical protein
VSSPSVGLGEAQPHGSRGPPTQPSPERRPYGFPLTRVVASGRPTDGEDTSPMPPRNSAKGSSPEGGLPVRRGQLVEPKAKASSPNPKNCGELTLPTARIVAGSPQPASFQLGMGASGPPESSVVSTTDRNCGMQDQPARIVHRLLVVHRAAGFRRGLSVLIGRLDSGGRRRPRWNPSWVRNPVATTHPRGLSVSR